MAAGGSAGTLYVNIAARTEKLEKGMRDARKQVATFSATTEAALGTVTRFGLALAGVFGARSISSGLLGAAENMDRIGKSAARLGVTTEALVGLQHGAEMSGLSTQALNAALGKFNKLIGDARAGSETALEPLASLGVELKTIESLPLDQAFSLVADRLSQIENPADRARRSMQLFGKGGQAMLTFLSEGSEGLEVFRAEAERLGKTFSKSEFDKIATFNDELKRLKDTLGGAWQGFVITIAPEATKAIGQLAAFASAHRSPLGQAMGVDQIWQQSIDTMTDKQFDSFARQFNDAGSRDHFGTRGDGSRFRYSPDAQARMRQQEQVGLIRSQFGLSDVSQLTLDAVRRGTIGRELAESKAAVAKERADRARPREFIGEKLSAAARMAENTAKNIAKLGTDGANALGLGAKWNELQRAALLAPFKGDGKLQTPEQVAMRNMRENNRLQLTQAGTAESYRQRQAIARQNNPILDVNKKQLKAQERIAVGIENLANGAMVLAPANLRG